MPFFFTVEFMSYFIGLLRFAAIYLSKIYRLKSLTKLWLNGLEKNLFQLINETVNGGTQILIKENDFLLPPFFSKEMVAVRKKKKGFNGFMRLTFLFIPCFLPENSPGPTWKGSSQRAP